MGIISGQYEANRQDKNWLAATKTVCMQIRDKLMELKSFQDTSISVLKAVALTIHHEIPQEPTQNHTTTDDHFGLEPQGIAYALTGNTYRHKEAIKQAGASWDKGMKKWIIRGSDKAKFERLIPSVNSSASLVPMLMLRGCYALTN